MHASPDFSQGPIPFFMISTLENNNRILNRHLCSHILYAIDFLVFCAVA